MVSEKASIATECPGVDRPECCVSKKKGSKNIQTAFFFFSLKLMFIAQYRSTMIKMKSEPCLVSV